MPGVESELTEPQRAELEAILQTSLEFGVHVQMSGGYTARVRDSMQRVALGLGADRAETWVSSGSIGLVVGRDGWTRTSVRTTPAIGINFTELSYLSRLSRSAASARSSGWSPAARRLPPLTRRQASSGSCGA